MLGLQALLLCVERAVLSWMVGSWVLLVITHSAPFFYGVLLFAVSLSQLSLKPCRLWFDLVVMFWIPCPSSDIDAMWIVVVVSELLCSTSAPLSV